MDHDRLNPDIRAQTPDEIDELGTVAAASLVLGYFFDRVEERHG